MFDSYNVTLCQVCQKYFSHSNTRTVCVFKALFQKFSWETSLSPCCRKSMSTDANSWWRFLQCYSCIKQCLSPKGMCFPLSKFSWHSNFTTFSLRVLCCYSLGCIPKLLLGSYSWRFQVVEKICEVIWRAVRRMTCGSCFKEMVKLCFFVHFGKGYGGPAKRWLYVTQQKQCLMCTIRLY